MPLRLVMLGTGDFAVPTFRALLDSPHTVAALVTQPDRVGRGHHHHGNAMKDLATARGVDVFQPERANAPESLARLREFEADLFVVAAYGQILSADLLSIPRLGAINVHASLLPKYRGAAPVQYAVLNGEEWTGISIFRIEPKLDAGPVLGMVHTRIARETSGELEQRLSELAPPLVLQVIDELERGVAQGVPQDPALVTRAPKMTKSMGLIDWSQPLTRIDCHVRAMQPWPMPFTFLHQPGRPPLRLLVLEVAPLEYRLQPASGSTRTANTPTQAEACTPTGQPAPGARPGTILSTEGGRLIVQGGDGPAEIVRLQPAGKRAMAAAEFLNGHHVQIGEMVEA